MKKAILLILILLIILIGGSYKPLIYKIFNDYEEVCVRYKMNAITTFEMDMSSWTLSYINHTEYISTGECIEYGLRRNLCNPNNDSCYFQRIYYDKSWKVNVTEWEIE